MISQIQIRQTYAKIGMDIKPPQLEIKQPNADVNIQQDHVKVEMERKPSELIIDSTRAWSALGKRPSLELTSVIYDETTRIVHETIAKIAQRGDRLAAIHNQEDPIPEFAQDTLITFNELYFEGEPNYDNVAISFHLGELDISWREGKAMVDIKRNRPEFHFNKGNVDIYLRQKNSLEIIPPNMDITI